MQPILSLRNFLVAVTATWLCSSCQSVSLPPASDVLTKENITEQLFTINTGKDTILLSAAGIRVHIPAGSIKSTKTSVTVVVKEALSLYDMLRAGLTTRSGDKLLRSNGMFYINTREASELTKPLRLNVPAAFADPAMQLFKGMEENGRVDWQDPVELKVDTLSAYTSGKQLFEANCTSCHTVKHGLTGPALAHIESRWTNREHLYRCIRNSQALISSDECAYMSRAYCQYKIAMNSFSFTDYEIECVLAYIRRETERLGIPDTTTIKEAELDACYNQYKKLNPSSAVEKQLSERKNNISPAVSAEYYNIGISTFGWFNIDAYLFDVNGVVKAKLEVFVEGSNDKIVNTYLIIPGDKIFVEGGLLSNKKGYVFYEESGALPLKPGMQAYIMATGKVNGMLVLGITPFVTAKEQRVKVMLKQTSQEKADELLKQLSLGKSSLQPKDDKAESDVSKEQEALLQKLRNSGWDCLF